VFPEVRVEGFDGPNLVELEPILKEIPDPIEARWEGSQKEFDLIPTLADRRVILYAKDVFAQDKLTIYLGAPISMDAGLVTKGRATLAQQSAAGWRDLCEALGHSRSTLLLVKIVADAVRAGKKPKAAAIAGDVILKGVNPADADILLRLKAWAHKRP
jgi:hypothetical protein